MPNMSKGGIYNELPKYEGIKPTRELTDLIKNKHTTMHALQLLPFIN